MLSGGVFVVLMAARLVMVVVVRVGRDDALCSGVDVVGVGYGGGDVVVGVVVFCVLLVLLVSLVSVLLLLLLVLVLLLMLLLWWRWCR